MYNNYSPYTTVTNMLENSNWPPLTYCRQQLEAIVMLKIIHQLIDIPTDAISSNLSPSERSHNEVVTAKFKNQCIYLHSFFSSGIKIWNNLPDNFITLSLEQFKTILAKYLMN